MVDLPMVLTKFGDLGTKVFQLILDVGRHPLTEVEDALEVLQQDLGVLVVLVVAAEDVVHVDAEKRQESWLIFSFRWWWVYGLVEGQEETSIEWMLHNRTHRCPW